MLSRAAQRGGVLLPYPRELDAVGSGLGLLLRQPGRPSRSRYPSRPTSSPSRGSSLLGLGYLPISRSLSRSLSRSS